MQQQLRMQRVLVTGGAGFLGAHVCERLVREGLEVVALDDLSTDSRTNLAAPLHQGRAHLLIRGVADPIRVVGTMNVLERARELRVPALLASTSEIYGNPEVHPQREDYCGKVNTTGPRACYDEGKRCGEAFVAACAQHYGVDARIARIFNTYGPRMRFDDGADLRAGRWEPRDALGRDLAPLPTPETKPPWLASIYALSKFDQERLCLITARAYDVPAVALRFFNVYGPHQALSNPFTGVLAIFASRLSGRGLTL